MGIHGNVSWSIVSFVDCFSHKWPPGMAPRSVLPFSIMAARGLLPTHDMVPVRRPWFWLFLRMYSSVVSGRLCCFDHGEGISFPPWECPFTDLAHAHYGPSDVTRHHGSVGGAGQEPYICIGALLAQSVCCCSCGASPSPYRYRSLFILQLHHMHRHHDDSWWIPLYGLCFHPQVNFFRDMYWPQA